MYTSGLGIVNGKHVDCDDLKHACASQRGRATMEKGLELLQHTSGNSWKTLHPARPRSHKGCFKSFKDS